MIEIKPTQRHPKRQSMRFLLLFILALHAPANSELFIFTADKATQSSTRSSSSPDQRQWYSPIKYSIPHLTQGDCLPIAQVASQLLPNPDWMLKLDKDVQSRCITWRSIDHQWYYLLRAIDNQNQRIKIWINHDEQVIAWSDSLQLAKHLAHRENRVWRLSSHLSLQKNIKKWTELIGWQLIWQTPSDYPLLADSIFFGGISESLKALIQQLNARTHQQDQGLKLTFSLDRQNKIIAIGRSFKELNKQ